MATPEPLFFSEWQPRDKGAQDFISRMKLSTVATHDSPHTPLPRIKQSNKLKIDTFTMNTSGTERPATPRKISVSEVTSALLDARLEAIEARMDSRVAGMSAKLDATLAEIKADRSRFTQLEADLRDFKADVKLIPDRLDAKLQAVTTSTDAQLRAVKANIWFGVATTIAAVGATLAIAIASFDSGRETSKNISDATARIEKIQSQIEAAAKVQAGLPRNGTPTPAGR